MNKNKKTTIEIILYIIMFPILLIYLIIVINKKIKNNKNKANIQQNQYIIKNKTITENEQYFYNIIKKNFNKYDIRVQIPLSNVIEKKKNYKKQYQNELNRIIDIGIFNKITTSPLLLIEINDNTHKRKDRKIRDEKVKNICKIAGIKLITFWTKYENKETYIINRISKELEDNCKI